MIRVLAMCAFVLSMAFALLSGTAIFAGLQQPPSAWGQLLHLSDCELPCWIGIEPGKTTLGEAQEKMKNAYQNVSLYQLTLWDYEDATIVYKPTGYTVNVLMFPLADNRQSPQGVVQVINFLPVQDKPKLETI